MKRIALTSCIALLAAIGASSCTKKEKPADATSVTATTEAAKTGTVTQLKTEDLVTGSGAEAVNGANVTVHYTGWLTNGTKFDSSVDRGEPFRFRLGEGRVIQGWEKGVLGMKVGGKRRLTIPSDMGYGEQGAPPVIPPNATLIFEVELLNVEK